MIHNESRDSFLNSIPVNSRIRRLVKYVCFTGWFENSPYSFWIKFQHAFDDGGYNIYTKGV